MGAFLLRFSPYGGPFSPCEGLFSPWEGPLSPCGGLFLLFSMWGAFFVLMRGPFLDLPPLPTKISAGAHVMDNQIESFFPKSISAWNGLAQDIADNRQARVQEFVRGGAKSESLF